MNLFLDHTKRSADELSADLAACRQFRHIAERGREKIIGEAYLAIAKCWMGPKAIKHPNPNDLCTNCGTPRSKYGSGSGLCYRCYASSGIYTRELWIEDVFLLAVELRGFTCDVCNEVHRPQEAAKRNTVGRILANLDGGVKPVLCGGCETDFKSFCSRSYGSRSWKYAQERDIEKMALGFFAQKVKVLAEQVKRSA